MRVARISRALSSVEHLWRVKGLCRNELNR
jgi:hypothetical protein